MEYHIIETHYWVSWNEIKANTRIVCSKDQVAMIYRITEILDPKIKIEISFLPPEPWSYKDIIKISLGIAGAIWWITWSIALVYQWLSYRDSHDLSTLEIMQKCIELYNESNNLSWNKITIDKNKLEQICSDRWIQKLRNQKYETLKVDETVKYEETIIKNSESKIINQNKIERENFPKMIIPLPEDEDFEKNEIEGVIELISLVIKQKKDGKWVKWRWTYFGENLNHNWYIVLENNEDIDFYMQDNDFKSKIKNNEISFANWDNIRAKFTIKWEIRGWLVKTKTIYVSYVIQKNEDIIEHRIKKKKDNVFLQQQSLFDTL